MDDHFSIETHGEAMVTWRSPILRNLHMELFDYRVEISWKDNVPTFA